MREPDERVQLERDRRPALGDGLQRGRPYSGELAEGLCKTYDVEYGRALRDVERQIEEWEKMGLLSRRGTGD